MGINSRKSLHPRWTSHHIPTIDGFKTTLVRITRRDPDIETEWLPDTEQWSPDPYFTVYEGAARIQPYGVNFDYEVALDPTGRRLALAQIQGKNLGIRNDDVLTVISTENPVDLLAYSFDIRGSLGSSLEWGTNLIMETNLKGN